MTMLAAVCILTTAIAIVSALTSATASAQRRMLPWIGGVLLGVGAFWILPEVAENRGWPASVTSVLALVLVLGIVDRYVYPICPFCAAGVHTHKPGSTGSCERTFTLGWPLLIVGCLHSLFDGWAIGLSAAATPSNSTLALSWGITIHKIPESVAIGLLAARLTSNRSRALGIVALIQFAMAAGGVVAVLADGSAHRWADLSAVPACALLLLFGLVAFQQEWRLHGKISAMRTSAPGVFGSAFFALATRILSR